MQATTAPGTPQAPATPGAPSINAGSLNIPLAQPGMSLRQLRALRSELSSQLENVSSRRAELVGQLRTAAPGVDKAGLESRIAVLDRRMAEMETDLAATGKLVQAAAGDAASTTQPPSNSSNNNSALDRDQITGIVVVFTLAVLMPLSIAWSRAIFRRSARAAEQPSQQLMARLDRMEEGIETIALEVERISEGQRFVTKVIAENRGEPVALPRGEGG